MRVLIADDEPRVVGLLRRVLGREGYECDVAPTGSEALSRGRTGDYDVIVLDILMPPPDGIEVCRRLRELGHWTPVLLLSARGSVEDRVSGLDAGADDYLPKPFAIAELTARLRSLVRRQGVEDQQLACGGVTMNLTTRRVTRNGREIALTPKEFSLLEMFLRRPGEVLSRRAILDEVWDFGYDGVSNVVDVYVRYLRSKIDYPFGADSIESVRGIGYRWRAVR